MPALVSSRISRRLLMGGLTSAALLGLAACGKRTEQQASGQPDSSTPSASPSPSQPTGTASPATSEDAPSAIPWTADLSTSDPTGDAGVETALRTGIHDGYDRVVLETSGASGLGWRAEFVEEATTQGKGDVVTLEGSRILRVIAMGTSMPMTEEDTKLAYSGPNRVAVGGSAVKEVYLDPTFEAQCQLFLGVEGSEYRVFALTEPARLVVDVRQP